LAKDKKNVWLIGLVKYGQFGFLQVKFGSYLEILDSFLTVFKKTVIKI